MTMKLLRVRTCPSHPQQPPWSTALVLLQCRATLYGVAGCGLNTPGFLPSTAHV